MSTPDVEKIMEGEVIHDEKAQADLIAGSELHNKHKSSLEKRLLFKADCVILPLAALSFFASYLV